MIDHLVEKLKEKKDTIEDWFIEKEKILGKDPIYASVDLRNAGYKVAPVDTNIFPAGFNNLCPRGRRTAGQRFAFFLQRFYPGVRRIAIFAEEHTRNLYYFEHLFTLQSLLQDAGFDVAVTSPSKELLEGKNEFKTAEGNNITVYRSEIKGNLLTLPPFTPDFILINNDFSSGLPGLIKKIVQPMAPLPALGWHRRKKSDHFRCFKGLSQSFAEFLTIDPWLISAPFSSMGEINFNDTKSMVALAIKVDLLLAAIQPKFDFYKLPQKPYVFVKNDAGTYGMAVMTVASGDELLHLNKRERSQMRVGKGKRLVTEVIIQEGIPTTDRCDGLVAEPVIYLVGHQMCGGFFRLNEKVNERGNLNRPGMKFTTRCFHEALGPAKEILYSTIARLASLAAGCETKKLTGS